MPWTFLYVVQLWFAVTEYAVTGQQPFSSSMLKTDFQIRSIHKAIRNTFWVPFGKKVNKNLGHAQNFQFCWVGSLFTSVANCDNLHAGFVYKLNGWEEFYCTICQCGGPYPTIWTPFVLLHSLLHIP